MDGALSRGPRRRCRGAASVEAVILLPVFILLLFSARHCHARYVALLRATALARECAFAYASEGCADVPERCESIVRPPEAGTSADLTPEVDEQAALALDEASHLMDGFGAASALPALDVLATFFGQRAQALAEETFRAHLPVDGSTPAAIGRYALVCNVPARDGRSVADELFRVLTDGL